MKTPSATRSDPFFGIVDHASHRYRSSGITAWKFARGKLRGDPIYRAVWAGPWLAGGSVLDVGCGQGLMLAVIASARALSIPAPIDPGAAPTRWPERLMGIETRPRVAKIAQKALGAEVEIHIADARQRDVPRSHATFVFDVLHMMSKADQDRLLDLLVTSLEPGGFLLVREADASAGWRFQSVKIGNRLKALLGDAPSTRFHFRSATGWRDALTARGLSVEIQPMSASTPFGNVLFTGKKKREAHRA